jgi:hypothetical protein
MKKNIAIQKLTQKGSWKTISYHGNKPESLISGLLQLAMSKNSPDAENLHDALVNAHRELVSIKAELIKLIEDYLTGQER